MSQATPSFHFSVDFGAPIWQIRPDYPAGLLALEIRDGERLQTDFAGLDVTAGRLLGPAFRAAENWWVGLEDTQNQRLYLHGFADRKIGAHRGITAVHGATKQVLWQHEAAVFYGFSAEEILIARAAPGEDFMALDSRDGTIVTTVVGAEAAHQMVAAFDRARSAQGQHPVHYPAGSEHFTLLGQFISSRTGRQPVGAIDYLETTAFFGLAYYVAVAPAELKNILGIYSVPDGALLHEVVLTEAGPGLSTGTFFVMQKTLLLVQERNTLVGYRF